MAGNLLLRDGRGFCVHCEQDFECGWQLYNHQRDGDGACSRLGISSDSDGGGEDDDASADGGEDDGVPLVEEGSPMDHDLGPLELPPPYDGDDHVCDDECDCDAVDDVNYGGDDLLKYESWGTCEVTKTGKEILRFLSMVIKGKSMSSNKAEDLLRYVP
jgi:hypothetical protein